MRISLWLVLSLGITGCTWLYAHRVLEPYSAYVHLEKGNMIAEKGDLYSPWVGARELLLHRRNPYGPEVTREIQMVFFGHPIQQVFGQPGVDAVNEQRFAYPVYTVFLLAPTVYDDFATVQRWAPLTLALLTAASLFFYLDIVRWRLPLQVAIAVALCTLSSPQIVQGLRLEQLALVVGCLLAAGAWCVSRNYLVAAGVLLAFSTIKPQMAILPLCWFAVWSAGDWPKRWRLASSFVAALVILISIGALLLPHWPSYFLANLAAYRRYALPSSVLQLALGDSLGAILGCLIVAGLLALAWSNRKQTADSRQFAWILAAFFVGAIPALPLFAPFNQVMLILPALLILSNWNSLSRFSRLVFIATVSWPWITSLLLLFFSPRLRFSTQLPLLPSFLIPFVPLILPLLLLTIRGKLTEQPPPPADLPAS
jgi:hypothetical protein